MSGIIEQETTLVRAGQLRRASALEQEKSQLAGQLYVASERLKANAKVLKSAPARCAELTKVQDKFRALLQKNMVVLATAHAVSANVVRGVNAEMQRRNIPRNYTAQGRRAAPTARHLRPLSISRSL